MNSARSTHAGAEIVIDKAPVVVACDQCGHRGASDHWRADCPVCGSFEVRISGGEDLALTGVTLEDIDGDSGST